MTTWDLQNPANTRLMPDKPLKSLWGSQGLESSSWTQPLERHDDETWKGQSSGQRTVFLHARTPSRGRTVLLICLYALAWSMPSTLSSRMSCRGRQLTLPLRDRRELKGASWVHGICMQVLTVWNITCTFLPRPAAQENWVLKFPDLREEDNT